MMQKRFDTIFESNFNRFQGGGFLTGDIIKLKDGWESHDWCKSAPGQLLDKVKELIDSGLTLRVSAIKAERPAVSGSVQQDNQVTGFHVDITAEMAPGMYRPDFITLPQDLIELTDRGSGPGNLAEIPDALRREEDVDIKPRDLEKEDTSTGDGYVDPEANTLSADPVNKKMTDRNTKLPGAKAAKSYTANYMEA